MKALIFSLFAVFFSLSSYGSDIEQAYYQAVHECTNSSEKLNSSLNDLDKKIQGYKKTVTTDKIYEKIKSSDFDGQIILWLGAYTLGSIDKGDLIPQRRCWLYYNNFLIHEGKKDHIKSKKDMDDWKTCVSVLNNETLPEVVDNIVNCYNKSHSN
jgi:hypothetical protein